jgi:hypothetical protein
MALMEITDYDDIGVIWNDGKMDIELHDRAHYYGTWEPRVLKQNDVE